MMMTKNQDKIHIQLSMHLNSVKKKIGLNFPMILRAILRQDPNVIMLGEIRDFETAEVALHAALTGHLVLSTLHTNGSIASITRLRDMGIKPYVISEALTGILAQRLVRRICPNCDTNLEDRFRFCPLCGETVTPRCKNCDNFLAPKWKICPYCGQKH